MAERKTRTLSVAARMFVGYRSPAVLVVIWLSFVALRVASGIPLRPLDVWLCLGVMAYWPFQEWWMHRWLLHLPAFSVGDRSIELEFARLHRLHHESPTDLQLTLLPLSTILGALVVFTAGAAATTGELAATASFMLGAVTSTILYEWVHFLTHTDYLPKRSYYRRIWKLHRWHHYKNERYWFSFTLPYIDGWFGTGPDPAGVEKSATARGAARDPEPRP